MTRALHLRRSILGALGFGVVGIAAAAGCGTEVVVIEEDGASSGSGESSSSGSNATGSHTPPDCGDYGRVHEVCRAMTPDNSCAPHDSVEDGCCNAAVEPAHITDGACCYWICEQGCCGRAFVVAGVTKVARSEPRADWCAQFTPVEACATVGASWLADAFDEHASVASFARFTLELMAHGAPPQLLADAQAAASDEIEHARLCFGQAARFLDEPVGPGPLSVGGVVVRPLAEAAAAAITEGCIGETIAALMASEQLAVAKDERTQDVLRRIAADEARHAALAWRFVAWALTQDPEPVREAVVAALDASPLKSDATRCTHREVSPSAANTQHTFGRLLPHERRAIEDQAWRDVIAPCADALLAA